MALDPKKVASGNLYGLTESDKSKFKDLYHDYMRRYGMPRDSRGGPRTDTDDAQQAPEVYIVRLETGIPAISGTNISYEECTVYQVTPDDNGDIDNPQITEVEGHTRRIHNVSNSELESGSWVLAWRDKYGTWFAGIGGGGGDSSFLAVLVDKEYQGDIVVYSWARVIQSGAGTYTESFPQVRGCPASGSPAYHERNLDLAVVGPLLPDTGTGSGTGSGTGTDDECPAPAFIHELSVVRMRPASGGDIEFPTGTGTGTAGDAVYIFSGHPWVDLFRRITATDGIHRRYNAGVWSDGIGVTLVTPE